MGTIACCHHRSDSLGFLLQLCFHWIAESGLQHALESPEGLRRSFGEVLNHSHCRIASVRTIPCPTSTSTWRSLVTISSGL